MSVNKEVKRVTTHILQAMKSRNERISMLTAYDYSMAKLMDSIVDIILVGDSLGMVVLGYKNTTKVTMQDMLRATEAVARATCTSAPLCMWTSY